MLVHTKRVFEGHSESDGLRILVDRIWPRGVSKDKECIDIGAKDIAPSTELRKWYGHDHAKWEEFLTRYEAELDENSEAFDAVVNEIDRDVVTLVYSSKETKYNNATALKGYIERHLT